MSKVHLRSAGWPRPPRTPHYFTTETTVDVEIDADDLHDDGWHHETECTGRPPPNAADVLRDLHMQAHPGEFWDPMMCKQEPCRSVPMRWLLGV